MTKKEIVYFAKTNFRKSDQVFGIKKPDRRQHMYLIGKTGVGKTALLKNMALQDIENGEGVAIIDPHGEFVEEVLDRIPSHRINDVVYFNPADLEYPIAFNVLEVPDPKYKHLIASGLIGVFTKIWANVWSARMEYILNNCILALLDTPGTTLLAIPRILVDKNYRQKIVNNLKDPVVRSFWINEYSLWPDNYRNEAIAPIQNKVNQFLNVSLIRNIVGQPKTTLNLQDIMDTGKILLVNVSKGRIGEDNSALLGAMIITRIQLIAMERVRIPEEKRRDFYLYVDEFQNFATEAFATILSEARKYRLNLIIAHQYISQLVTETSTRVRDAVFGNVGTLICFRVGAADAEFLEREFIPEFSALDLVNLDNYNIYLKLMIDGVTSRPFSAQTLAPKTITEKESHREKIIQLSRQRYSTPREEVEARISRWSGVSEGPVVLPSSPSNLYEAQCSICKKKTRVIFRPEEGRAVYCKSCLKKIEKGEIKINQKTKPVSLKKPKEQEDYDELRELGIEFAPRETSVSPKKSLFSLPQISLKSLKKEQSVPHQKKPKKGPDIEELRKTLAESLSKLKEAPEKQNNKQPET